MARSTLEEVVEKAQREINKEINRAGKTQHVKLGLAVYPERCYDYWANLSFELATAKTF